jgi:hypothetical protein
MSEMNGMNHETPAELRGVEAALDRLARAEREVGGTGLEHRLHAATRSVLMGGAAITEPKAVVATIRPASFRLFTRLRVAAGLALVGTVGAVWLAGMRTPPSGMVGTTLATKAVPEAGRYDTLDAQVESVLAWNNPMGEGFEGLSEQIDLLYADFSELDAGRDDSTALWFDGSAL